MKFSTKDYALLIEELRGLADENYALFLRKLIPVGSNRNLIIHGVRVKELRTIAKRIAKGAFGEFLLLSQEDSHEEVLITGFVIAYATMSVSERMAAIELYLDRIGNWAQCDSFCSALRSFAGKNRDAVMPLVHGCLAKEDVYKIRFAVVMLLTAFVDPEGTKQVLSILKSVRHADRYVQLAVSWAVAECFLADRDGTVALLQQKTLDRFVQNQAIQKIRDSFRVSKEDKQMLQAYRL